MVEQSFACATDISILRMMKFNGQLSYNVTGLKVSATTN